MVTRSTYVFHLFLGQKTYKMLPKAAKRLSVSHFSDKYELLMKFKMAAILDDVTGPQQCHNLQYLRYLADHITGHLLEVKYSPNIVTAKTQKRGCNHSPQLVSVIRGNIFTYALHTFA